MYIQVFAFPSSTSAPSPSLPHQTFNSIIIQLCTPLVHSLPSHLHRSQLTFSYLSLSHSPYNLISTPFTCWKTTCPYFPEHSFTLRYTNVATHVTVIIQATERPRIKEWPESLEIVCSSVKDILKTFSTSKKVERVKISLMADFQNSNLR